MKRHPRPSKKKPEHLQKLRKDATNPNVVYDDFDKLKTIYKETELTGQEKACFVLMLMKVVSVVIHPMFMALLFLRVLQYRHGGHQKIHIQAHYTKRLQMVGWRSHNFTTGSVLASSHKETKLRELKNFPDKLQPLDKCIFVPVKTS
ncbi:hypothetical protein PR048_018796 [Dryococelus australis]|uniref:Uncharacterized protein n=1 Tax=Dryococelus australis TaxID=614101 RepID=A0ABQ9H1M7_9NEOP|nr:hypothetical protein PR048_018796 [Dryococelus australis]